MSFRCLPTKCHFSTGFALRHLLGIAVGLIVLLAASVTASERDATALFPSPKSFKVGDGPYSVAVADLDSDSVLDLVTANWLSNDVSVLLGNGDNTFQAATSFAVGARPRSVAVADFDGNGDVDVVTADGDDDSVSVLLGNGDGTLQAAHSFSVGDQPESVAVADVDGDSVLDLVTANFGSDNVSVLLGNGDGTFQAAISFAVGDGPYSVVTADLDGDGVADLATADSGPPGGVYAVSVLLGNGDGTFQAAVAYDAGGTNHSSYASVAVADLNADGDADLVTTNGFELSALQGNGDGTFRAAALVADVPGSAIAVADLDGDGGADLVISGGGLNVLLGNGDGTFQAAFPYMTGRYSSTFAAAADLDGDDVPDLVTANFSTDDVSVLPGNGDGTFRAGARFGWLNGANYIAIADLDGDGVLDLTTTNSNEHGVGVLLGNGDGTYQPPARFPSSYSPDRYAWPVSVVIADLDRDAILDLAVANSGRGVGVLLGNGDGSFQAATSFAAGNAPYSIAAADFDGDGVLDLVTANSGYVYLEDVGSVSVLLGNGDGSFQGAISFAVGKRPLSVAAADLDGDGVVDLVAANAGAYYTDDVGSVSVLLGNGDGSFRTAAFSRVSDRPKSVAVADLNGDTILDLVTANSGNYYSHDLGSVSVLLGNGDGSFKPAATFPAGNGANSVAVADLDGDGVLDLTTANLYADDVSVLLGNGDGTFGTAVSFAMGHWPESVAVADLDGDSLPDLATANVGSDDVTVLFNQSNSSVRAEIEIKPGSDSNPINPSARGNIPVAILGSDVFDVTNLDVTKLAFGAGAAAPSHDLSKPGVLEGHLEDLNGDGFTDLVSHYRISDSGILPGDTTACLMGKTLGGASFTACDSIRVITGR